MINLLSKTTLGRSGHVRFPTCGTILHVWGSKLSFLRNFEMILHGFCWRSSKNMFFDQKPKYFTKNKKIPKKSKKLRENPGFPRDPCGDPCGDLCGRPLLETTR